MNRFARRGFRARKTRGFVGRQRSSKPAGNWVPVVAVNEALSLTGTAVDSFVLLEDEDVDSQATTRFNRSLTVSRVVLEARIRMLPVTASGTPAMSPFSFWYGLLVMDNDEQSGLLNTAARGELINANRVLHWNLISGMWARTATTEWDSLVYMPDQVIKIDWKGGVRIGPEQYLAFALHTGGAISTAYSGATLNMLCRTRMMGMR